MGFDQGEAQAEVSPELGPDALEELRRLLGGTPPEIPSKYLYDDRGSALFEQITHLPEYYPTRAERELLRAEAPAILSAAGEVEQVVELGSGAAHKVLPLLHGILGQGRVPHYLALDISAHALERTRELLAPEPGVVLQVQRADYQSDLRLPPRDAEGTRLVIFLGGTLGNERDTSAVALFSRLRQQLSPGDTMLVGASLLTDPRVIEAAYNDAAGVTAAFNLNVLSVVNRLAGTGFDPRAFWHHAFWNDAERRIEMWLRARHDVEVPLGQLGGVLRLGRGGGIRTEISRRFNRAQLEALLEAGGFTPTAWFATADRRFGLVLGRVPTLH
jgi:L-histidine N-alpha-methyltransferase